MANELVETLLVELFSDGAEPGFSCLSLLEPFVEFFLKFEDILLGGGSSGDALDLYLVFVQIEFAWWKNGIENVLSVAGGLLLELLLFGAVGNEHRVAILDKARRRHKLGLVGGHGKINKKYLTW